jgi:hypothetical protein
LLEPPILHLSNNTWASIEGCGGLVFFEASGSQPEPASTSTKSTAIRSHQQKHPRHNQQQHQIVQQQHLSPKSRQYAFEAKLNFLSALFLSVAKRDESPLLMKYVHSLIAYLVYLFIYLFHLFI